MSQIDKKQVEYLAALARIEVSSERAIQLEKDLSTILEYVEALKQVNTEGLPEVAQVTGLKNVLREDVPSIALAKEGDAEVHKRLLDAFPEAENGYLKVKAIFE